VISSAGSRKTARVDPVEVRRSRGRGRPRKTINQSWLEDAVSGHRKISLTKISEAIGVHRNSLAKYLKLYGVWQRFSEISDHDLDIMIRMFKAIKPNSGLRYVIGFLKSHGLRVQRNRIRRSMRRVNRLGTALRRRKQIDRGQYKVPRPNHLWHLDGHHKLIQWGIVIHGIVDGYCRTVSEQYG
jgi:hypothetical protein